MNFTITKIKGNNTGSIYDFLKDRNAFYCNGRKAAPKQEEIIIDSKQRINHYTIIEVELENGIKLEIGGNVKYLMNTIYSGIVIEFYINPYLLDENEIIIKLKRYDSKISSNISGKYIIEGTKSTKNNIKDFQKVIKLDENLFTIKDIKEVLESIIEEDELNEVIKDLQEFKYKQINEAKTNEQKIIEEKADEVIKGNLKQVFESKDNTKFLDNDFEEF